MPRITLVNYGLGNIQAFVHIYERLNIPVDVAVTPDQLANSEKIILPGVGAFDWAMTKLNNSGLREKLDEIVLEHKIPVLGVCVGMQMMSLHSDEGVLPGLGWIKSNVVRFNPETIGDAPLPHMGWNDVIPVESEGLFRGIAEPRYYFLHSYYIVPRSQSNVLATAQYGTKFTAAVQRGNVFGTQFHPEKSHDWGIEFLRNFATI